MRKLALDDEILLTIEKPARYIGNEVNAVMKDKSLRKESKVVQTKKQYGDFSLTALSFASISIFSG